MSETKAYVDIIDFAGPPDPRTGRIEVQISVWSDEDMTDLIDVYECFSIGSMNRAMAEIMDKYRGEEE